MNDLKRHGKAIKVYEGENKVLSSLEEAIDKAGVKDGMTISFHHHFREGDYTLNMVMAAIAKKGIKDICIASSSLGKIHEPLIEHIQNGVVTEIHTSGLRGKLAEFISKGGLEKPITIRSHGGRARAVEAGEIKIDVAFLAVPSTDAMGNASGIGANTQCGSLGYAIVDAHYADTVVLLTDDLKSYPNMPASIRQQEVDYIVKLEKIGDPEGISADATRFTKNPKELKIAENAAKVIRALPYFKDQFSFQTGSGGASLAVTRFLKDFMKKDGIKASFILGGISQPIAEILEEGLTDHLFDTQTFDAYAIESFRKNPNHHEISVSEYANPWSMGSVASQLDYVILSALEIDRDFNVNVMTGSDGIIMGASGGHSDTAESAKVTVIVAPLYRGRIATVVDKVTSVITPGKDVDVLVTERGIAVNPARKDILAILEKTNLPVVSIDALADAALKIVGKPDPIEFTDRVVANIEYRDGSMIDVIYQSKA
ncbi:citrate lyase subunit alpha [Fusibacter paucivorans]|uniref:Citrate lyase alpha chain n=1 Tax=Fusibacter paucivorans TaxID=76009 RepID=A0ABS5PM05_9FIRM|nr:citrate lyase subunit alpha [Fusibacter paucivorans]MBS7525077.1 citrate lyase subunit alpha [Fusibacter paucivorans]